MHVYRFDVMICASAYIKAKSPEEAFAKVKALKDSSPDILDSGGDVDVSGLQFDNPDLPDVSLSPAMTICDPVGDADDGELMSDEAPEPEEETP